MHHGISQEGAAGDNLGRKAMQQWAEAATVAGVDMEGFDVAATSEQLTAWALARGLEIGTLYARFSTKMQQSTDDQVRECIVWAARANIFVPPACISIDEAVKGSRVRRVGLDRTKQILATRGATVLLVFKASRLFRQAGQGFQFIQQEVVEEGLRAVSVSQGIDTNDKKTWKLQMQVHGLMDDMLLDAIGDHVRAGQVGLFLNNYTTGALGVGYRRREVPDARPTNRGLPRTVPEVDPDAADLIRRHAQLHLDGMPIKEGVRRWNSAGGPCDPRSTTGKMTYAPYRRLLSNRRLTGHWEFGRKRNQFSSKRDYVTQVEQPDEEVTTRYFEDLRILDDETFFALQSLLNKKKTGPRGPRNPKRYQLWDLATELFHCKHCSTPDDPVRFYTAGGGKVTMQCRRGDECGCPATVRRDLAVQAVCDSLTTLIARDAELVEAVVCRSQQLDSAADDGLQDEIVATEKKMRSLTNRIDDLFELSGQGSDADRRDVKARIRSAQSERTAVQAELNRLNQAAVSSTSTLTSEQARAAMSEMSTLLSQAAAGELGDDAVYKALSVFRSLTGGRIWVRAERRAARKHTNVRGEYRPCLVRGTTEMAGAAPRDEHPGEKVSLWLRKPPRLDAIAERVHQLIDEQRLSYRDTAKQLRREGHNLNSGNVWYSYQRWYEMQDLPVPDVPYNNGKKRRSA